MANKKKIVKLLPIFEQRFGQPEEIYLLFADLCGSTEFKKNCLDTEQPELVWISRQLIFLERAAEIINKYEGNVVKTIGDEVFACFDKLKEPGKVLKCAIEVIQSFDNLKIYTGKSKINAKISIDFGPTYNGSISEAISFDPIGLSVDRCARLNSIAASNEIIFSQSFWDRLTPTDPANVSSEKLYGYKKCDIDARGLGKISCYKMTIS
ncbi:MAG: adenylate/guanylate cyclase domain-containing protein [Candidatus Omnitrophica bacterium]|nr:adenylate/guanylate cyclase domain-containing protein [Candidatus Omnitrophota bacterium]